MASKEHSVDVLIAARDCADTIERAVLSALNAPEVHEVIVIDDSSMDDTGTRARCCDPSGQRLTVKRLASNVGPAAARNVGIEISSAPWLAILDADDFFLPCRIHRLLVHSDQYDFVADRLIHIPEGQRFETQRQILWPSLKAKERLNFEQFVRGNITRRGKHRDELGYLQPLIRRQFLETHRLRYDETLRFGEDYVLYARALAAGARFLIIPDAGYVAIERPNSLSTRHTRTDLEKLGESILNGSVGHSL